MIFFTMSEAKSELSAWSVAQMLEVYHKSTPPTAMTASLLGTPTPPPSTISPQVVMVDAPEGGGKKNYAFELSAGGKLIEVRQYALTMPNSLLRKWLENLAIAPPRAER